MAAKVCVVVGIGPGIGSNVAKKFAAEGYQVAVTARTQAKVDELAAEIGGRGYAYDAADEQGIKQAFAAIRQDFGANIHTLIYNAGSGVFKNFASTSAEDFERCWRTIAYGLFLHAKEVTPEMVAQQSGVIGMTGATASLRGMPNTPAFAPARFAQRSLAQSLAREFGPKGIHVFYSIIDGIVDTPTTRSWMPDKPDIEFCSPAAIADTYFAVANQPSNCWTFEFNIIPGPIMGSMATV
mmetsp:Transcript_36832/g.70841  ORF Transcript_36832/g.70841 Transcript_36832/m.70841 type:complete len:239 (-) Transcript_36832:41-757(-)